MQAPVNPVTVARWAALGIALVFACRCMVSIPGTAAYTRRFAGFAVGMVTFWTLGAVS